MEAQRHVLRVHLGAGRGRPRTQHMSVSAGVCVLGFLFGVSMCDCCGRHMYVAVRVLDGTGADREGTCVQRQGMVQMGCRPPSGVDVLVLGWWAPRAGPGLKVAGGGEDLRRGGDRGGQLDTTCQSGAAASPCAGATCKPRPGRTLPLYRIPYRLLVQSFPTNVLE